MINIVKKNSYLKAGGLYLLGNVFNKGMVFLTIPIFTRILTTHEYGLINTYISWVTVFVSILGLSMNMGVMIGFTEYEHEIDDYMSSVTTVTLVNSVIVSSLVIAVSYLFKVDMGISRLLLTIALVQAGATAVLKNYDMYLKFKFQYVRKSALEILPNFFTLFSSIIIIIYFINDDKHMGKIIPHSILMVLFAFLVLRLVYGESKVFNKTHAKVALKVSFPFIFHSLSMTLLNQSDRIMLTSLVGASETGVYSLVYNFSMAGTVIFLALNNVWLPWFTQQIKIRAISKINEKAEVYLLIMTIPTVGLILTAPEILRIIAPFEYWTADISLPFIILASYIMFVYIIYVNIEHFHKKTKAVAVNTLLATLLNIGLNYYVIQLFGFHGAAVTTFVSYLALFCLHYRSARKLEQDLFPLKLVFKPLLFITANVLIYYLFLDAFVLRWILLAIQLAFIGTVNHRVIIDFIQRAE
ncbi:Membrane protein involved in the export of O-antigen and teichoic acid [Alkalibacterium subtropicum]|uniref:Membrane protein involved in the export of O-antigen and teichoic acid n=1 Tax=Alkalibacterium subtropicum TaxID=753702 RepID=A0A1I1GKM5_9LACT|nr:oligosaccharide flippase family protein [Alkalibacterium subtropicum]SFC09883.1 Membrane protein involved in the export of O-antigen and teichoic acid [Alkalibacterium subtropicum]